MTMSQVQRTPVIKALLLALVALVTMSSMSVVESFTPPTLPTKAPLQQQRPTRTAFLTRVHQSSMPSQKTTTSWIDLPNRDNDEPELFQTEILIGRLAMVGAVALLAKEVITGESFLEQASDVVATFSTTFSS